MGDRAHVYLHEGDEPGVYVYSHWNGYELPEMARKALDAARPRWGDPSYSNRMFVQTLLPSAMGELGWGLNTRPDDTGDGGRVVDVNWDSRQVTLQCSYAPDRVYTFDDYVATPDVTWAKWE